MKNKLLTVAAVVFFFSWGAIAWGTGDYLLAQEGKLAFLAILRNSTYVAAAAAVFLRYYLRRVPNEAFLVTGSALCAISMFLMTQGGNWIPVAYLIIGVTRIVMIPPSTGFAADVLGPKLGIVVTAGGMYVANATIKPVVAWLIKTEQWRYGLGVGIVFVIVSAICVWLARPEPGTEEVLTPNTNRLGSGAIAFVLIQVSFGLMALIVFPLATELYGEVTDAGILEAIRQSSMFVGVMVTLLNVRFSIRIWLLAQLLGGIALLAGMGYQVAGLVYFALCAEGVSFAVLEKAAELAYLEGLAGLPNRNVVIQLLDAGTRFALIPGEALAAGAPLQVSLWTAALLPLFILLVLATPFKRWLADKLLELARKE